MRKRLRKWMPDHETIRSHRWLQPFAHLFQHHNLWHLHRRSVAGGVAVGLFCGLIPGPLQMISAALLALLFRVNLPVALFATLYTNPFTIVPLYLLAYEIGAWVIGGRDGHAIAQPALPEFHWGNWPAELLQWLEALGKPILIGLPLLGVLLALVGYLAVRLMWRVAVISRWRARAAHRRNI